MPSQTEMFGVRGDRAEAGGWLEDRNRKTLAGDRAEFGGAHTSGKPAGDTRATGEVAEDSTPAADPAAAVGEPTSRRPRRPATRPRPYPTRWRSRLCRSPRWPPRVPRPPPASRQRPWKIPTGVSPTGANARSAAVGAAASRPQPAQAAGAPAGDAPDQQTAQQPAATTVSGSSVPQTRSVVAQATPVAATAQMTAPTTTTSPVSSVVADALAWAGLSPSLTDSPVAPVESPAMLAVLAGWRRQSQQALAGENTDQRRRPPQTSQTVDPMVTGDLNATGITVIGRPLPTHRPCNCRRR